MQVQYVTFWNTHDSFKKKKKKKKNTQSHLCYVNMFRTNWIVYFSC